MKRSILAVLLLVVTIGTARAEMADIAAWDILMTTCQLMPPGQGGDPWPCTCNGQFFINHGGLTCTPSGLVPTYPMTDPSRCPNMVSTGITPEQDNICGNILTDPNHRIPQVVLGVDFRIWGCADHDRCYGDCTEKDRDSCDNRIRFNLTTGCQAYYPANMDWSFANRWRRRACIDVANHFWGFIHRFGQQSFINAKIGACKCGEEDNPAGCNGGVVFCLFFNQPGCDGMNPINPGIGPPGGPPWNPGLPGGPGADF
jgi:hypothetical protein